MGAAADAPEPDSAGRTRARVPPNPTLAIAGTLERRQQRFNLRLEILDPATGRTLRRADLEQDSGNPRTLQVAPVLRLAKLLEVAPDAATLELLEAGASHVTTAVDAYLRGAGRLALGAEAAEAEAAITLLEQAITADPLFVPPRITIGQACLRQFEADGDRAWLERGITVVAAVPDAAPAMVDTWLVAGALHEAEGDRDAAVAAFEHAAASAPFSAEVRARLARALQRNGDLTGAERALQHAMFLRPDYWPDHHWAATLYTAEGRYDAAVNEFRRVVELAPRYVGGYNNLGAMYAYLDQPQRAREVFERSLAVAPGDNYAAFTNLGTLAFGEGRYADAAEMFERALAVEDRDYQVWGNLGHAYARGTTPDRAERPLHQAVELAEKKLRERPGDSEVLSYLAGYHAELGEREAAAETLAAAVAQDPQDPQVIAYLGQVFEDIGDRERALEWIGKALAAGVEPVHFNRQPSLRGLITDERYRRLVHSNQQPVAEQLRGREIGE